MSRHGLMELRTEPGADEPVDVARGEEVTLYVKGFLARGEQPDHFGTWLTSHRALKRTHAWGPRVVACRWPSGDWLPRSLAAAGALKGVVDAVRVVRNVRRAARMSHWGALAAEELGLVAAHFLYQYAAATRSAAARAQDLADHLDFLAARHERVRVVAHSLGCRHVIEAVSLLAHARRPAEIHLCAPACRERDVTGKLGALARERTRLYYTRKDRVLDLAFTPVARGRALGHVGPERHYAGLETVEVGAHFEFWVHAEYARRLPRLIPREPHPAAGRARR